MARKLLRSSFKVDDRLQCEAMQRTLGMKKRALLLLGLGLLLAGLSGELAVRLAAVFSFEVRYLATAVVYRSAADNLLIPKTHYNALISLSSSGALPWYPPSFSINLDWWHWYASS